MCHFIAFEAQAASYFVQPIVTVYPGAIINGLEIDGATFRAEGYNNAPTSVNTEVDLEAGTIRGNATVGGGGLPTAASQGRFGEQVTFHDADNTSVEMTFNFDGTVQSSAANPNLNSTLQIRVDAYIAIFDPSAGATRATKACSRTGLPTNSSTRWKTSTNTYRTPWRRRLT